MPLPEKEEQVSTTKNEDDDDDNDALVVKVANERIDYHEDNEVITRDAGGPKDNEKGSREEIALLSKNDDILLTPELEDEIVGPESFTTCGIGPLTSPWLQKLARPEMYLAAFSLACFAKSIFFTYAGGTMTTVERRFKLPSSVSGFISTGNDILQLFLSVPLAFVVGNSHRPRWLGIGMILSAGGSLLIMTPHLIYGAGDYNQLTSGGQSETTNETSDWAYCGRGPEGKSDCSEGSTAVGSQQYVVATLQFLGQVTSGLLNVYFDVVGYTFLDEAVPKDKLPIYFAISGCLRIFGPVVGSAIASYTATLWVDLGVQPIITPSHPQWIGAWWLGYPIIMVILLLSSIPMLMMPRQLPGTRKRILIRLRAAAKQGKEAVETYKEKLRPVGKIQLKDIWPGLVRLSKNKVFLIIFANQTFFWAGVAGYMFEMKYMEHQFKVSVSESNRATAVAGMLATVVGWLGMGSLLTFLKPSTRKILYITMATSFFCFVIYLGKMNIACERDHIIGLEAVLKAENPNADFYSSDRDMGLSTCMANCNCSAEYSPVCSNNSDVFFSACHAGCKRKLSANGSLIFEDCICADMQTSWGESNTTTQSEVRGGLCSTTCQQFIYYVAGSILIGMLTTANRAVANIIFLRSVHERDKDLALGALNAVTSLMFIMAPICVGSLVDYCCILWERTCGHRGYCYLYDLDQFRWILHSLPTAGVFLSFVTEAMLLRYHNEIDFFGEKEMEELELFDIIKNIKNKKRKKRKTNQEIEETEEMKSEGEK